MMVSERETSRVIVLTSSLHKNDLRICSMVDSISKLGLWFLISNKCPVMLKFLDYDTVTEVDVSTMELKGAQNFG